jgi:hypothetical protein
MNEITQFVLTFMATAALNGALIWVAFRNARNSDSKSMVDLQDITTKAIDAQKAAIILRDEAFAARDEAVAALDEYKRMRVADFEIVIVFSLHPVPTVKDVTIRSLPDAKKSRIVPDVKLIEEDTKPLPRTQKGQA